MEYISTNGLILSIITPIKDPNYIFLTECVDSVVRESQRNTYKVTFIHLFIVSGFIDPTFQALILSRASCSYQPKFFFDIDCGLYDAMNKGVDLVEADYYYFLNHDDFITNNFGNLIHYALYNPSASLYCANSFLQRGKNFVSFSRPIKSLFSSVLLRVKIFPYLPFNHGGMLFSREVFVSYRYALSSLHDDFLLFLSLVSDIRMKIIFLPYLYIHYFRLGGLSTSISPIHKFLLDYAVLRTVHKQKFLTYVISTFFLTAYSLPNILKFFFIRK